MVSGKTDKRSKNGGPQNAEGTKARGTALLLDRALPPGYLREWTERIATRYEAREASTQSVVVFRIGAERLALPTYVFREVAESCPFHSLPHRAGHIAAGLVIVRGEILICVSLETLLGLEREPQREERKSRHIYERVAVVEREGDRFAFPVNEVCAVVRYHSRELKEVPATLAQAAATYTLGLLPWQDHTVGCLDEALLFYTVNRVIV